VERSDTHHVVASWHARMTDYRHNFIAAGSFFFIRQSGGAAVAIVDATHR